MGSDITARVVAELRLRVGGLRQQPFDALVALPAERVERTTIGGSAVEMTTMRETMPDGRVLVLVRSDRRAMWGLIRTGSTEGFWAWPDGRRRAATAREIMDVVG